MIGEARMSAAVSAADWIRLTLSGSMASAMATIAIAGMGLLLLAGRIDVRRGALTILGCFLVFGAGSIAQGFLSAARNAADTSVASGSPALPTYPTAKSVAAAQNQMDSSPYAGVARPSK